ncbi:protein of unknown function [Aliiroseovarius halocynthiae]|uniref:DUF1127 domain-containing protein n=1 Tax=Aliiroseovarius halocynthiae TaxID=985055 RepID=A0A545SWF4_9RHOB|nr:DUF1127 domain-containing protein [Aliiroseovarius halocynthiae]TQV69280.1 DUF1127 domain-containing protein [Aliiroseovarius halocynthiae]SMR72054.1 protein of unknown function [Aliiroseovarius halocynthiae]
MEHGNTYRHDRLAFLDTNRPLPALAEVALIVAVSVTKWRMNRSTRRALRDLPDHLHKDIGISKTEAQLEAEKPFWRG